MRTYELFHNLQQHASDIEPQPLITGVERLRDHNA